MQLTPAPGVAGNPDNGRRLFTESLPGYPSGCGTCHTVAGVASGALFNAPNLTNVTLRSTLARESLETSPANLSRWIRNAREVKPDTLMPALTNLTDQEAQDLTAFLYSQPYNPVR
jgi:cytochrome c oxidase subunit 2